MWNGDVQEEYITTEDTEFHGEKDKNIINNPALKGRGIKPFADNKNSVFREPQVRCVTPW